MRGRTTRESTGSRTLALSSSVVAIFGPTASGKSAVAAAVAERVPAELIAGDSMQLYRGLPILTNQTPARLVATWSLDHDGSVGEYQALAHAAIDDVLAAGRLPIVVGGSGLYLRAALSALALPPLVVRARREHWEQLYVRAGGEEAHRLLGERDPRAAAAVHPNDRKRVVRALELWEAGSSLAPDEESRLWTDDVRHPTLIVGLDVPREELVRRIEQRTRAMFDAGVEEEVRNARAGPLAQTIEHGVIGLRAIAELPREEAIAEVAKRTRALAAYQRKWMRRLPGLVTLDGLRPPEELADEIVALAGAGERLSRS